MSDENDTNTRMMTTEHRHRLAEGRERARLELGCVLLHGMGYRIRQVDKRNWSAEQQIGDAWNLVKPEIYDCDPGVVLRLLSKRLTRPSIEVDTIERWLEELETLRGHVEDRIAELAQERGDA